ncbi:DNA-binding transcriptional LysR family regulator [Lactobacillus colini]|uniref:DNA-binding transcriptional LysR family regulator n=1 Tax=Lactobacillus colini TaxID=1819254 RepID=A0ABS4MGS0_9LACO|nr:LysR family transcriptional regulator [Lactobacillus colini]MBP2058517.1 DNA-binding transcriptional LysR family regulator [Lactobacillus colini]
MELKYLNDFLAVAKFNNFSDAAESLYISQSSLSKNIKKLEDIEGVKLFNRNTTGTSLTHYGKIYLNYAKKISSLENQCDREIKDAYQQQSTLQIGAIPSANEYGITELIIKFMKESKIKCHVMNDTSGTLEKFLAESKLDLAFIKNSENTSFTSIPFKDDILMAVLPSNHPLAKNKTINLKELKDNDFIFEPVNSRPYNLCVNLCEQVGFTPNVIYADRFIDNILEFVKKDVGISLLMNKLVPDSTPGIVKIPIIPNTVAEINLCYIDNSVNQKFKKKFISFTQNYASFFSKY